MNMRKVFDVDNCNNLPQTLLFSLLHRQSCLFATKHLSTNTHTHIRCIFSLHYIARVKLHRELVPSTLSLILELWKLSYSHLATLPPLNPLDHKEAVKLKI